MKCSFYNARKNTITSLLVFLLIQFASVPVNAEKNKYNTDTVTAKKNRCNFYIFTHDASKKINYSGTTVLARICLKSIFQKKKLYVIVARNSKQAANKIISILIAQEGMIGNLWFDSHGLYKQGYSSFHIGSDEFSYKNIHDTSRTSALKELSMYCDAKTKVGIGSCYGGATFNFPGSATAASGRMNGDSLMMGMGKIFLGSTIYGSESWVMEKPGIFNNNFGFAGYPIGNRYRTIYWHPVWERLGKWNRYSTSSGMFEPINTVALNTDGSITVRARNYQELKKGKRAVAKNLARLINNTLVVM